MKISKNLLHNQQYISTEDSLIHVFRGFSLHALKKSKSKKFVINSNYIWKEQDRPGLIIGALWYIVLILFLSTFVIIHPTILFLYPLIVCALPIAYVIRKRRYSSLYHTHFLVIKKLLQNEIELNSRFYNTGNGIFENEWYILLDTKSYK